MSKDILYGPGCNRRSDDKASKKFIEELVKEIDMNNFEAELTALINKYSLENGSDTPDFILADFLIGCLESWNNNVSERSAWYGNKTKVPESVVKGIKKEVKVRPPTNKEWEKSARKARKENHG